VDGGFELAWVAGDGGAGVCVCEREREREMFRFWVKRENGVYINT